MILTVSRFSVNLAQMKKLNCNCTTFLKPNMLGLITWSAYAVDGKFIKTILELFEPDLMGIKFFYMPHGGKLVFRGLPADVPKVEIEGTTLHLDGRPHHGLRVLTAHALGHLLGLPHLTDGGLMTPDLPERFHLTFYERARLRQHWQKYGQLNNTGLIQKVWRRLRH
jgi:hypothetical protein